jgi:hypothetical protein
LAIVLETDISKAKRPSRLPSVCTSFNWAGYERYGKNFIDSWLEHWSPLVRLVVYYEGDEFDNLEFSPRITWRPIEEVEFLRDYMESLKFPIMHGIVGDRYDINFDARMARKPFMQSHTAKLYGGKVFWIDADVVTKEHVPESFLDDCLPDDALCCYLGRDGWYFTESGFIGFNSSHPKAREFFKNYLHTFITGTIFAQAPQYNDQGQYVWGGWHDCIGFDCVRHIMGNGEEFLNLAAHVKPGHMHPFQMSAPGKYMHHLKGNRKDTGILKPEDTA